ncbi:MAG: hypothetical protein HY688_01865 [Chloroflexi bacterium]|nr:hypothetical protein [Chloroflexota bacterium]
MQVTQEVLWALWQDLDLSDKVRRGLVQVETAQRYANRPETLSQTVVMRLRNGWIIAFAHRHRPDTRHAWSLGDPKAMYLDDVVLFTRGVESP